ncbi:MAG: hypothetical protein IKP45_00160 [Bacteroidales bacterium]|nr:hypothetical protein [Bacteroidales bacterium]
MKKITILSLFLLATLALCAQRVPQIVNFSAVLRDSVGNVMSDTRVRMRLIVLEGGAEGSTVYTTETRTTTNSNGYVNLLLNRGMASYGTPFEQIPWENGDFSIQVDYKTDDMSNYRTQGCYELTSNFYAFVAGKANKLEGIDFDADNPENGDALMYNSETGKFEARELRPPAPPALSVVLEAGNDAGGMNISNLASPVAPNDIVTKEYADSVYHRIITAISNINCSYNGHEYVDLGLPSGTMWAKCNVGAATPEDRGDFYAYGEIYPNTNYSTSTYTGEQGDFLPPEADVASVFWGGGWHIPTIAEMDELRFYCIWEWNGQGYIVTGPNGCSIFIPVNNGWFYIRSSSVNYVLRGASDELEVLVSPSAYATYAIRPVFRPENNN